MDTATASTIIQINHDIPFVPEDFIGYDWSILREDKRFLRLSHVDLSQVSLEMVELRNVTNPKNALIGDDVELVCLKRGQYILLGAKVFQMLWENKLLVPASWKDTVNGEVVRIHFDGTILLGPGKVTRLHSLCLYWKNDRLNRGIPLLSSQKRSANDLSAVLRLK